MIDLSSKWRLSRISGLLLFIDVCTCCSRIFLESTSDCIKETTYRTVCFPYFLSLTNLANSCYVDQQPTFSQNLNELQQVSNSCILIKKMLMFWRCLNVLLSQLKSNVNFEHLMPQKCGIESRLWDKPKVLYFFVFFSKFFLFVLIKIRILFANGSGSRRAKSMRIRNTMSERM